MDDWNDGLKTPFAGEKVSNSLVSIELTKHLRDHQLRDHLSHFFDNDNSFYFWHASQDEFLELRDINLAQLFQVPSTFLHEGFQH